MKKLLLALAGIIAGGFLIGFTIGKLTSPDYDNEANVLKYIYSHITPAQAGDRLVYSFACGGKSYAYDAVLDSVLTSYTSPLAVGSLPTAKKYQAMNLNMIYSIAGGGPTAIIGGTKFLDYLAPLSKNQRLVFGAVAVLTTASGIYWGYRLGYAGELDCASPLVQKILADKNMWKTYAGYRMSAPTIGFIK